MNTPLQGLLVVSLEQAVAAPYCSSRLADAGARVIKIERAEGDFAREYDHVAHGESAYFVWLNRGKESICLDIKDADDAALLQRMLVQADVFIQNLSPGAAARSGFDSAILRAANPRLITVDISGYGDTGPYQNMKAYDLLVQCEAGLAAITGSPDQAGRVGVSVCDIACGMYAHTAVLQALLERGQTGLGQGLEVSLFDAIADWMSVPLLHQDYANQAPQRVGLNHPTIAPYGAYSCSDGSQIVISIQNNREWQQFCEQVLLRPDCVAAIQYATNSKRCENRRALDEDINAVFSSLAKAELLQRLQRGRIAYGSVNSVADLSAHPQLRRATVATPTGPVFVVAPPVRSSNGEAELGAIPQLGEQGVALRNEFSAGGAAQ
jgi:crotonobetainyl-CoA:carnitine CoA-transferase CaiB-like acyl-CoA transferase